jgi:hypothetical protein
MSQHVRHVEFLSSWANRTVAFDSAQSRLNLIASIVHCADLGGSSQSLHNAMMWCNACNEEFKNQAINEEKLGIPVTQAFKDLKSDEAILTSNLNFIENFVIPLWKPLTEIFPKLRHAMENIQSNRNHLAWQLNSLQRNQQEH